MAPLIAVHAVAASFVLTLGPVQLLRRRRDRAHRLIGRAWVGAMVLTCLTAFAIHPDGVNWLHGLAAFTLLSVGAGVVAIRRGHVAAHRGTMTGSYIGTSIAFGFAAFLPDRAIARMAVSDPLDLALAVGLILATTAAIVTLAMCRPGGPRRDVAAGRDAVAQSEAGRAA